jgi:hypothetical protein
MSTELYVSKSRCSFLAMLYVYFVGGEGFEPSEIGLKIMKKKTYFIPEVPPIKNHPHF